MCSGLFKCSIADDHHRIVTASVTQNHRSPPVRFSLVLPGLSSAGQVEMSRLALYLLGPPRVERDGEPVTVRRRKAMALLAYLAVTGECHTRDALATLFWPDSNQSRARAALRAALASLRKALGEDWPHGRHPLDVDRESVGLASRTALDPEDLESATDARLEIWVDVTQFHQRLAVSRSHSHPPDQLCAGCLSPLAEAAELYRDDFMTGFTLPDSSAFDEWQFFQGEGLRNALSSALERLAQGLGAQGEYERAIVYARRWVALDPLHEPAQRLLTRLYAISGQRTAALRQVAECVRVLEEELGAEPEPQTVAFFEQVRMGKLAPPDHLPVPAWGAEIAVPLRPFWKQKKKWWLARFLSPASENWRDWTAFWSALWQATVRSFL